MQHAIWTGFLIERDPEEAVRRFADCGWSALELCSEHGRILLERGNPEREGTAFRRYADDLGVSLPQGHLWLGADIVGDDGPAVVDELRRWIDLFAAVGVRAAVLHPGGAALREGKATVEEINPRRAEALRTLLDHAQGTELRICLENCPGTAGTVDELMAIIDATGSDRLGICLDTGHLHLVKGDQADFIRRAGDRLWALHIDDNDGSGDEHLMPFGGGKVDWVAFAAALRASTYSGLANLEIPGERHCPPAVQDAKLRYLHVLMEELLNLGV